MVGVQGRIDFSFLTFFAHIVIKVSIFHQTNVVNHGSRVLHFWLYARSCGGYICAGSYGSVFRLDFLAVFFPFEKFQKFNGRTCGFYDSSFFLQFVRSCYPKNPVVVLQGFSFSKISNHR
jgi:hypothetical protein